MEFKIDCANIVKDLLFPVLLQFKQKVIQIFKK